MNRNLLALAIGAALALPVAAQAAPTVYGLLNLSVDRVDFDSTSEQEVQVNSNASRLGIKGEETLGQGLSAVYMAEWGVSGDGDAADLSQRNRFLGLKSDSFGTIKLGKYDTPFKTSQGTVDQFNDMTYADMGNFLSGENRLNNIIGYESPKIADALTINLATQSGEDTGTGDDDSASLSVVYNANGLYLAAAMDNDVVDDLITPIVVDVYAVLVLPYPGDEAMSRDALRVTGIFTADALQVGAMVQTSEFNDSARAGFDLDETALLVSAAYTMDKNVVKGQVTMVNHDFGAGAEIDTQVLQLGLDHNFTQTTKAFAQASWATYDYGTGTDDDDSVISVGMQTKF